jgi:glycosyltransferase involved in cell wall biosynthesis
MQIIGITMMRNEADIADLTIRHHLRIGCDRILAVDNGSTDETPVILERLARRDPRIQWTSDPGTYRQAEIMTGLAREAFDLGADWIMPFDADEFWSCRPGLTIPDFLRDAAGTAGFLAPVVNFVQNRRYQRAPDARSCRCGCAPSRFLSQRTPWSW